MGIILTNEATKEVTLIARTAVLVNDPSKITFVVTAGLAFGDYKLTMTTQYSSSETVLKEPRTYTFDYVLNVTP